MRDLIRLKKKKNQELICEQHADLGANFITERLEGCAALSGHRWMHSNCLKRGRHERKRERKKRLRSFDPGVSWTLTRFLFRAASSSLPSRNGKRSDNVANPRVKL